MTDYVNEKKEEILDQHKEDIAGNSTSEMIKKLSGKLWTFKALNSKKAENLNAEHLKFMTESMKVMSVIITEKGIIMVTDSEVQTLTYKINSENGDSIKTAFFALDSENSFEMELKLKNNELILSKEEGENLILQEADLTEIPDFTGVNIRNLTQKETMKYLGENADSVLEAIF